MIKTIRRLYLNGLLVHITFKTFNAKRINNSILALIHYANTDNISSLLVS
ncbi:hypothetical protein ACNQ2O_00520 [Mycoplasma sp. AA7A]